MTEKPTWVPALGLGLSLGVMLGLCACASTQAKQDAAASAYAADMLRCVDQSPTKAVADACREGVRQQWAKDGGR